jgi:hypothetical protein
MVLAFYINVAIDQQCEIYIKENQPELLAKIKNIQKKRFVKLQNIWVKYLNLMMDWV